MNRKTKVTFFLAVLVFLCASYSYASQINRSDLWRGESSGRYWRSASYLWLTKSTITSNGDDNSEHTGYLSLYDTGLHELFSPKDDNRFSIIVPQGKDIALDEKAKPIQIKIEPFLQQGNDSFVSNGFSHSSSQNSSASPEPRTLLLFGTGLVGIVCFMKKKSKKQANELNP